MAVKAADREVLEDEGALAPPQSAEQQALQKVISGDAAVPQIKDALAKVSAQRARKTNRQSWKPLRLELRNVLTLKQEAQADPNGVAGNRRTQRLTLEAIMKMKYLKFTLMPSWTIFLTAGLCRCRRRNATPLSSVW